MTATAVGKGVKAACIDGGIRGTRQINEKKLSGLLQVPHPQRESRSVFD